MMQKNNGSCLVTLPAGQYWLGDPCHVMSRKDFSSLVKTRNILWDKSGRDNGVASLFPTGCVVAYNTALGDGIYDNISVDSGLIGVVAMSLVKDREGIESGREFVAEQPFSTFCNGRGKMRFGRIVIDTDKIESDTPYDEYDEDDISPYA